MEFSNVKLVAKANVYHGGKVSSRTFFTEQGERKTLGFMLAGDYEFGTAAAEEMKVLQGEISALLPGKTEFESFPEGSAFNIPANSSFKVKVTEFADYCCSYFD